MAVDCSICFELFNMNSDVVGTSCGHLFHKNCLDSWMIESPTCPQCRNRICRFQCFKVFLNVINIENVPYDLIQSEIEKQKSQQKNKELQDEVKDLQNEVKGLKVQARLTNAIYESQTNRMQEEIERLRLRLEKRGHDNYLVSNNRARAPIVANKRTNPKYAYIQSKVATAWKNTGN